MVKNSDDFAWEGVLHEFVRVKGNKSAELIADVFNEYINDGSRSKDPHKITKDIHVLKKAIKDDPENNRYVFYLARTYWSVRNYKNALRYFEKRAKMGGCPQEVYYSLLYIGICQRNVGYAPQTFISSFCHAYLFRPSRIESLYELVRYYEGTQNFFIGYLISKFILSIPVSQDFLFIETWVYDWGRLLYFYLCASKIGKYDEAQEALVKLVSNNSVPAEIRKSFKLDEAFHEKNFVLKA